MDPVPLQQGPLGYLDQELQRQFILDAGLFAPGTGGARMSRDADYATLR